MSQEPPLKRKRSQQAAAAGVNHGPSIAADQTARHQGAARPRRSTPESLSYLAHLEGQLDELVAARQNDGPAETNMEPSDASLLVPNLLDELTYEIASLAMERHAALTLEKVTRICSGHELTRFLSCLSGYSQTLATNRYSSHVLQTAFSVAGPLVEGSIETQLEETDKANESEIASLVDVVVQIAEELRPSWWDLIHDISGTHSVRALFCLLAGMPLIAERRGKNAKHQHSHETALPIIVGVAPALTGAGAVSGRKGPLSDWKESLHTSKLPMYAVPGRFRESLQRFIENLGTIELKPLHEATCHVHAGPALCLLIQAVARAEDPQDLRLKPNSPYLGPLIYGPLCWSRPALCTQTIYAMSGEVVASRFLETILWHGPFEVVQGMWEMCLQSRVVEFGEHEVANFVLQTWLQVVREASLVEECVQELSAEDVRKFLLHNRAGVISRLLTACLRTNAHYPNLLTHLAATYDKPTKLPSISRYLVGLLGPAFATLLFASPEHPADEAVDRLTLHVPGARIVDCLIRMPGDLGLQIAKAVVELPREVLYLIARDNTGSRTLFDSLLDRVERNGKGQDFLADKLVERLVGRHADLLSHPVGFHVITRLFRVCHTVKAKKVIVGETMGAEHRLVGNNFGRRALGIVGGNWWKLGEQRWEAWLREGAKKREALEDVLRVVTGPAESKEEKGSKRKRRDGKDSQAQGSKSFKGSETVVNASLDLLLGICQNRAADQQSATKKRVRGQQDADNTKTRKRQRAEPSAGHLSAKHPPQDLSFVLEAIKASGESVKQRKDKRQAKCRQEASRTFVKAATDSTKEVKEKVAKNGGKRPSERRHNKEDKPLEKAQKLGRHGRLSHAALMRAVHDLEAEHRSKKQKQ